MRNFKKFVAFGLTLAMLALPFLVWWKAQALTDWWQLHNYTPPAAVATIAGQDAMTGYARHVFYVNHPDIQPDVSKFRADCQIAEQAIVLGCYRSNQDGIFIYDVQDARLAGVEQVTAAHEMLHGAYDRLSAKDRSYVDGLLQDFYNNGLHDQRVIDEINSYRQTEPNDLVNEMHSVFGTEVQNLPAPLETYYGKYFSNRGAVTAFAASYEQEFTSREDQIKADKAQLDQLKATIDSEEQDLNIQLQKINSDRARLDSQRSSGQIQQYNAGVAQFNDEVSSYNNLVQKLRSDIDRYNQLVDEYNSIAKQLASLEKSIDTRLSPQAAQ